MKESTMVVVEVTAVDVLLSTAVTSAVVVVVAEVSSAGDAT